MNNQVLVAFAKQDHGTERAAEAVEDVRCWLRERGGPATAVSSEEVPWQEIMQREGGWQRVYEWTARVFLALVVVETTLGTLAKGQHTMVKLFLAAGKRVGVLRNGQIHTVIGATPVVHDDRAASWQSYSQVAVASRR